MPTAPPPPQFTGYNDLLGYTPENFFQNYLSKMNAVRTARPNPHLSGLGLDVGATAAFPVGQAAASILPFGYNTLAQMLMGQGRTDPAAQNQLLASTARGTQEQQGQVGQSMAQMGLGRSGVGAALQAAVGNAGAGQLAGIRSQETQMAEQRKRSDLELLKSLVLNPAMDFGAMGLGQSAANRSADQQSDAAKQQMYATLIMALAGCWVAAELYGGWYEPRTVKARLWLHTEAPERFRSFYLRYGRRWAELIRRDSVQRAKAKLLFDSVTE